MKGLVDEWGIDKETRKKQKMQTMSIVFIRLWSRPIEYVRFSNGNSTKHKEIKRA